MVGVVECAALDGVGACVDGGTEVARAGRGGGSCPALTFVATFSGAYMIDGIGGIRSSVTVLSGPEAAVGGVEGGVGTYFGAGFLQLGSFFPLLDTTLFSGMLM